MHLSHVPEACRADYAETRAVAARFLAAIRRDPATRRIERAGARRLAIEWFSLIAITYAIAFGVRPLWLRGAILVPWSLYAGLALDNITHYANHWPLFESRLGNAIFRASGALVLFNPLEIKHVHAEHHRAYSRPDSDERVFGPGDRGKSFAWYLLASLVDGLVLLWPLREKSPCVAELSRARPREYKEIVAIRWSFPVIVAALLALDARSTLVFFLPAVAIVGSFASLVMNLTDHIPGDPHHPFRLATYLEPETRGEALFSAINHHTAATHLTHHLFPQVHWAHLPALQREIAPIYARHGAPRSLLVNSTLAGNPIRFALLLREIGARRFEA